jgi:hypothetical protein
LTDGVVFVRPFPFLGLFFGFRFKRGLLLLALRF